MGRSGPRKSTTGHSGGLKIENTASIPGISEKRRYMMEKALADILGWITEFRNCYSQGRADCMSYGHQGGNFTAPYSRDTLDYMFWRAGWESVREEMETKIT